MQIAFPRLSVLVVHYKRTGLAVSAVNSVKRLGLSNVEYVLADDGTQQLDLERLRDCFDTIIVSCKNKGLGHNMNQGIMACRGQYLFVMQEDTEYVGSKQDIVNAMAALDEFRSIEMIRLYGSSIAEEDRGFVTIKKLSEAGVDVYAVEHKHPLFRGSAYSDMPHIRRNPCGTSDGWMYAEDCRMERTEQDYINRFAAGDQQAAFLYPSRDLVVHHGQLVSHRTERWDYKVARMLKGLSKKIGINPRSTLLRPIRKIVVGILPHARITYKD